MTDVTADEVREPTAPSTADERLLRERGGRAEHAAVQVATLPGPRRRRLSLGPAGDV
ncbi:MAG TPA: hypothetical protein VMA73_21690 [Streptosporangiaceae bacterium]|nr:hypothetical protein [Streptosporangiaceae bacterium]